MSYMKDLAFHSSKSCTMEPFYLFAMNCKMELFFLSSMNYRMEPFLRQIHLHLYLSIHLNHLFLLAIQKVMTNALLRSMKSVAIRIHGFLPRHNLHVVIFLHRDLRLSQTFFVPN